MSNIKYKRKAIYKDHWGRECEHLIYDFGCSAELHRYTNKVGILWSAIYDDDKEYYSCPRDHEENMLLRWNNI